GNVLFFTAGGRLWRSDGTAAGTVKVGQGAGDVLNPTVLQPWQVGANRGVYFVADTRYAGNPSGTLSFWKYTAGAASAVVLAPVPEAARQSVLTSDGTAYHVGTASGKLYRLQGDSLNAVKWSDGTDVTGIQELVVVGPALYFTTSTARLGTVAGATA